MPLLLAGLLRIELLSFDFVRRICEEERRESDEVTGGFGW